MHRLFALFALFALSSFGFAGCTPSEVCGDGPACTEAEHCLAGSCVTTATTVSVRSFTASPEEVSAGAVSTLLWATRNAASCQLSPGFGSVPRSGSLEAKPTTTTTFTLECEGASGSARSEVTVTVRGADGGPTPDDAGELDGGAPVADGGPVPGDAGAGDDAGEGDDAGAGDAGPADAGAPVVTSSNVHLLEAPPPSVDDTVGEQGGASLFRERAGLVLDDSGHCDALYPGPWGPGGLSNEKRGQTRPGLALDSWLLHVYLPTPDGVFAGELTFARPILAVDWRESTLTEGDPVYAASGTVYGASADRAFRVDLDDSFTLSNDRRNLSFQSRGAGIDELRILVDASDGSQPTLHSWTVDLEPATDVTLFARPDDDHALLLDEGTVTLSTALAVDATAPTQLSAGAPGGTLPAGTSLRSFLIHFDSATNPPAGGRDLTGTIAFSKPILALIGASMNLALSDEQVGDPSVTYPGEDGSRGIELGVEERFWWSEDGKTVRFSFHHAEGSLELDQVRVLTQP